MRRLIPTIAVIAAISAFAAHAPAASQSYNIDANGFKEVNGGGTPNQGDLDGTAIGTVFLDNGTGVGLTGSAIINVTLSTIDFPLGGFHIHQAPSTTTGGIVLDFGSAEAARVGNLLSANVINLNAVTITNILASPSGFYFNLHNTPFPGGAVRSQLPEPAGFAAFLLALSAGTLKRRRV